jgi:hypothetical protein
MSQTSISKIVMRRVYYAYAIAIASHSMFWQGAFLGACIALFGRLTHVASLIDNMLAVPVGSVPAYVGGAVSNAVAHGELLTVLVTAFMLVLTLSVTVRLAAQVPAFRKVAV